LDIDEVFEVLVAGTVRMAGTVISANLKALGLDERTLVVVTEQLLRHFMVQRGLHIADGRAELRVPAAGGEQHADDSCGYKELLLDARKQ
jgi:hypothetical protein